MSKMVILDGYTMNPGDLSWAAFEEFGELTVYEQTPDSLADERIGDADIVLTSKVVFDHRRLSAFPSLRYIGVLATGYNVIDAKSAAEFGITVTNIPEYATMATAQATVALLLELTNRVGHHDRLVHEGAWMKTPHFCFWDGPLLELSEKTLGLLGYGRIARRVARIARELGMNVIASGKPGSEGTALSEGDPAGPVLVSGEELLGKSDFVSLHCPLTEATRYLIDADRISRMKDGAYLINAARGPLLDEAAVADALRSGKLAGVAVDVLSVEPAKPDNPLLYAPNCIITPHIAWAPKETRERLIRTAVSNLRAFLSGKSENVVS
ncbi:MAG: D-2-hydroxyacid dehydrogenase [Oscillospiraceae bacterium]|nr:D-2-hydroxyacid dehydrogenase [Oscillospiraceae bacterium]